MLERKRVALSSGTVVYQGVDPEVALEVEDLEPIDVANLGELVVA